jgi:exodeoxyribonuclease III
MRVCTWNINSIRARLGLVERYLTDERPDVLLLQETKAKDIDFPLETFQGLGYETARAGQPSYNGVAILSRFPLQDVKIGLKSGDDPGERRVLRARVLPDSGASFTVCSVYVPNGKSLDSPAYEQKLTFLDELRATLAEDGNPADLVLGGDFNIARDERDVFDSAAMHGQLHFTARERKKLDELLELGLTDSLREFTQDSQLFSWWDYRMQAFRRNRGLRIDYLFAGKNIVKNMESARIDRAPRGWDQPSDHTPVVLDFRWP